MAADRRSSSTTWRSAGSASSTSRTCSASAVRERKKVEMVVDLVEWDDKVEYDRLGVEEQKYTILDIEVPLLVIPVRPGRNLTTIVEVAARNHLLKLQGHHSAKEFQEKLSREIAQATLTRGIGDEVE